MGLLVFWKGWGGRGGLKGGFKECCCICKSRAHCCLEREKDHSDASLKDGV